MLKVMCYRSIYRKNAWQNISVNKIKTFGSQLLVAQAILSLTMKLTFKREEWIGMPLLGQAEEVSRIGCVTFNSKDYEHLDDSGIEGEDLPF